MDRVTAAWREFNLKGHAMGASYNLLCPKTETSVPEIGFRVRSLKPDVIVLDYINLLTSSTGADDAQWLQLGNISREAKLLANKLNCVVILLAQIDDTYNLRYSKAIKDHANFVMSWVRDEAAQIARRIVIKQQKARNAPLYPFELDDRFDIAQFRDPDQQDRTDWPTADDLLMMEIKCQKLGLMLEPTASKEFDRKQQNAALAAQIEKVVEKQVDVDDIEGDIVESPKTSLLFSEDDAMMQDFSTLPVKSISASLLRDNPYDEDIV